MNGPSGELTRLNIRRILDVVDATELFDEAIRLTLPCAGAEPFPGVV